MAQIQGISEAPDRLRVQVINYLAGDIPNESIPEYPEPKKGINYVLYHNPIDGSFWFEEEVRELTEEEKTSEIFESIPSLVQRADSLASENVILQQAIIELTMILGNIVGE